jgi:hypothetical protein
MSLGKDLRAALVRAENNADNRDLNDIAWIVGGFEPSHPVRRQAHDLPRLQARLRSQRPCRSEIHCVMRAVTHRTTLGIVGNVANRISDMLKSPD